MTEPARPLLVLGLLAATAALALQLSGSLAPLEQTTIDVRFALRGERGPPPQIVIAAIDEQTLDRLQLTAAQVPRDLQARALRRLTDARAAVVIYDLLFSVPSRAAAGRADDALARAIRDAPSVVQITGQPGELIVGGRTLGAREAHDLYDFDSVGKVARIPHSNGRGYRSLAVESAEAIGSATGLENRSIERPDSGPASALVDFRGPADTFTSFSFARLLEGPMPNVAGKAVLIGSALEIGTDRHATPTDVDMAGVEVQANALTTALEGYPLRDLSLPLAIVLTAAFAMVLPLAGLSRVRFAPIAAGAVALGVLAIAGQLAFNAGLVVPIVYPLIALLLSGAGTLIVIGARAEARRRSARETLARFVPPAMVDEVLSRAGSDLRLDAERKVCTILFCDLADFVTFAQGRGPEVVAEILNRYFTEVSAAIGAEGGTTIAYLGDGVMAAFGTPLDQPDHADRAIRAARAIGSQRIDALNDWLARRGITERFQIGIGVNSGEVMAGNVGSPDRVEYAALGAATNLAARLQAATRDREPTVLIAEATRLLCATEPDLLEVGELSLRGHPEPIRVWTVPSER